MNLADRLKVKTDGQMWGDINSNLYLILHNHLHEHIHAIPVYQICVKQVLSYLKGGSAIEFGDVNGVWGHIGDVGDELFQRATWQLKVCRVYDDLNQLDESDSIPCHSSQVCVLFYFNTMTMITFNVYKLTAEY